MFDLMLRSLPGARMSTAAYFALNGFVLGIWIVHIPAVEQRVGIGHALLGWLLLLFGAGAFVGMQLVGPLVDRFGARRVVPLSAALYSATLGPPALAVDAWTLGMALLLFGAGHGALDVGMNAHAVQVEAGYRRPIMSAFHAMFSIGGALAAVVGALTLSWGWSITTTLIMVSMIALVVAAAAGPTLLGRAEDASTLKPSVATSAARRTTPGRIWALAGLALILMLSEGVANDWSVLAMRDALAAPADTAALAYGAFATTMTIGRLLADRVVARWGPVAVVRCGSVLASLAFIIIALSPSIPLTIAGWALVGIGLCGAVPQLFSAAGHTDPDAAGANVSRVAGLGYLGMLAGPAVIGPLTHLMPLNYTFLLPALLCVVAAAVTAHTLQPRQMRGNRPSESDRCPGQSVADSRL